MTIDPPPADDVPPVTPPSTPDPVPWAPKPIAAGSAFIGLCTMRNGEAQLRWQGAYLAFVLNPPAYAGVVYRLIVLSQPPIQPQGQAVDLAVLAKLQTMELSVLAAGCMIFTFMNLFLLRVLVRDGQFMTFWNETIAELERENRIEGDILAFASPQYLHLRNGRGRLQNRLITAVGCAMVGWLAMSVLPIVMIFGDTIVGGLSWLIG